MKKSSPTQPSFFEKYILAIAGATTLLVIVIAAIAFVGFNQIQLWKNIRPDEWGNFGDFIGGILGAVLAFYTIVFLSLTFKHQKEEDRKGEIETRFLKLLEVHRQNISEMKIAIPHPAQGVNGVSRPDEIYLGREVFSKMFHDFYLLHEKIKIEFEILQKKKDAKPSDNPLFREREIINVTYYLLSFGIRRDSPGVRNYKVHEILKGYEPALIELFLLQLDSIVIYEPFKSFINYHPLLSHYHRHLFQMVQYIDQQPLLREEEKYQYLSILRAQFDPYEQVVFFYNSLCYLGEAWEWIHDETEKRLVTKYNLIRNAFRTGENHPDSYMFYGLIDFEYLNREARKHRAQMRKDAGLIYNKDLLVEA